jgi:hypothetical protein
LPGAKNSIFWEKIFLFILYILVESFIPHLLYFYNFINHYTHRVHACIINMYTGLP